LYGEHSIGNFEVANGKVVAILSTQRKCNYTTRCTQPVRTRQPERLRALATGIGSRVIVADPSGNRPITGEIAFNPCFTAGRFAGLLARSARDQV